MIVQACLNGARPRAFHPALPLSADAIAADAAACVAAGAAEIHVHPRGADGAESLAPEVIDAAVAALRARLPGTAIGISSGAWIERDDARRRACIEGWSALPDYASVNLAEADAPAVIDRLLARGIGVEAGIATPADVDRLLALGVGPRCLRLLIEIGEQDWEEARAVTVAIEARLAGLGRPILLHGFDALIWRFVEYAAARRYSTRIGLEDGATNPGGGIAVGNAEMVRAALRMMQASERSV
jgi:uncharacterized protein (DUF849 family)